MGKRGVFAHVLRRTGFGPFPGDVDAACDAFESVHDLIDDRLDRSLPFRPLDVRLHAEDGAVRRVDLPIDIDGREPGLYIQPSGPANWWVTRMLDPGAGVDEKMAWIWHGIMPTSSAKAARLLPLYQQLRCLHRHALGSYRELLIDVQLSAAMLLYLDGNNSNVGGPPNENHARELFERFTLGTGAYSQSDVVAASQVMAGWTIDLTHVPLVDNVVHFVPDRGLRRPLRVLGIRGVRTVPDLIDAILAQDACAPFVVGRLWDALVGGRRDAESIAGWSRLFRSSGYRIRPLVSEILHSRTFLDAIHTRPRSAIEWYCAAVAAAGAITDRLWDADLERLGQLPYLPPTVAGWPYDASWLSPSQQTERLRIVSELTPDVAGAPTSGVVDWCLSRASLDAVSESTKGVLGELDSRCSADPSTSPAERLATVLRATLMTPEFGFA